jgi:hypothetical protein
MEKNWLIRTKSNHILGPISKDKLRELYRNGSIKPDDEVCAGNGFWFFVRENEFVEKYLLGDQVQGFNPVSEAKDTIEINQQTDDDITLVGKISLNQLNKPEKNIEFKDPLELSQEVPSLLPGENEIEIKKKVNSKKKEHFSISNGIKSTDSKAKKNEIKQNFLKWLGILGFIILVSLIYFRKRIIRNFIETSSRSQQLEIISSASAQDIFEKKKS